MSSNYTTHEFIITIGNLYKLSDETFTFYTSYLLFKYLMFLDFKNFYFIFTKYINIYSQNVNYHCVLSFNHFFSFISTYTYLNININILKQLYFFSICLLILDITCNNLFSELGSRATSMNNTVQNATENIKHYTLLYNRFRQAKITNELIEILSSTMSME